MTIKKSANQLISQYERDAEALAAAIAKFPGEFGLREQPGMLFRISPASCYVSEGVPVLYSQIRSGAQWIDYAKGTVAEFEAQIVRQPLTEDAIVNKVADDVVIEPDQQLRIDELSACFISRTNGTIALSSALTACVKRALARELRLHALEIQRGERFSDE